MDPTCGWEFFRYGCPNVIQFCRQPFWWCSVEWGDDIVLAIWFGCGWFNDGMALLFSEDRHLHLDLSIIPTQLSCIRDAIKEEANDQNSGILCILESLVSSSGRSSWYVFSCAFSQPLQLFELAREGVPCVRASNNGYFCHVLRKLRCWKRKIEVRGDI